METNSNFIKRPTIQTCRFTDSEKYHRKEWNLPQRLTIIINDGDSGDLRLGEELHSLEQLRIVFQLQKRDSNVNNNSIEDN